MDVEPGDGQARGGAANMRKMAHCGNLSVALYVTPALATRFDPVT